MCDLPSVGSVDAGCAFMCDVRLRDEGSQFGEVNGRGANAEHAMTEGAKSGENGERNWNRSVLGRRRMHRPLLRVRATKLRA